MGILSVLLASSAIASYIFPNYIHWLPTTDLMYPFVASIVGLVLGTLSLTLEQRRRIATLGIVLSSINLLFIIGYIAYAIYSLEGI
jgi:hypothetical protein